MTPLNISQDIPNQADNQNETEEKIIDNQLQSFVKMLKNNETISAEFWKELKEKLSDGYDTTRYYLYNETLLATKLQPRDETEFFGNSQMSTIGD